MKKNIYFKLIISLIVIVLIFPYMTVLAIDSATAGAGVAAWAVKYYNEKQAGRALRIVHPYTYGAGCYETRILDATTGMPKEKYTWEGETVYVLDCVGWVNLCCYGALQKTSTNGDCTSVGEGCYIAPSGEASPGSSNTAVKRIPVSSLSDLRVGDILIAFKPSENKESHVAIYIGGNELLESFDGNGPKKSIINSDMTWNGGYYKITHVGRFEDEYLADIDGVNADIGVLGALGSSGNMSSVNFSEFYYNGVPDGRYSVAASFWEVLIEALKDIFTFLVNIIFYIFRMVFVGFTAIFELLITYVMESIVGEANLRIDTTTPEASGNITVEKIIFNDINIFDVNFFKPAPATTIP